MYVLYAVAPSAISISLHLLCCVCFLLFTRVFHCICSEISDISIWCICYSHCCVTVVLAVSYSSAARSIHFFHLSLSICLTLTLPLSLCSPASRSLRHLIVTAIFAGCFYSGTHTHFHRIPLFWVPFNPPFYLYPLIKSICGLAKKFPFNSTLFQCLLLHNSYLFISIRLIFTNWRWKKIWMKRNGE